MNRSFHKSQTLRFYDCSAVEVKSKFGAEFRRFSLDRHKPGKFEDFYQLVVHTHHISNTEVTIGYADVHGDLLPINNDDNFCKAVSSANPLLRVFIQKREEADHYSFGAGTLSRKKKVLVTLRDEGLRRRPHLNISMPHDFRPVSSIIDVDILPETHRRVRLYRHGCEKPLGFYIRDGTSVRVTPHGLEKVECPSCCPYGLASPAGKTQNCPDFMNARWRMHLSIGLCPEFMLSNSVFLSFGELFTEQRWPWLRIASLACACLSVMCGVSTQGEQDTPRVSARVQAPRLMASKLLKSTVLFPCCCSDLKCAFLRQTLQNQNKQAKNKKRMLSSYKTCSRLYCHLVYQFIQKKREFKCRGQTFVSYCL
ncbi:partitioning defective 6 homolog gamma isoform X2 [Mus caroli]|uniref:Partitioning defective 6 homolog gamma isoform X2 n=1 Tax=Mus caroli TaxID=10089 RepID=A0A6P7QGU9_MUSCR|nr:partitioning defective 6 homolog gamma isoform X2 [Mus caroli]